MILTINNTHIRYEAIESVGAAGGGAQWRVEVRTISGRTHFLDRSTEAGALADVAKVHTAIMGKLPCELADEVQAP